MKAVVKVTSLRVTRSRSTCDSTPDTAVQCKWQCPEAWYQDVTGRVKYRASEYLIRLRVPVLSCLMGDWYRLGSECAEDLVENLPVRNKLALRILMRQESLAFRLIYHMYNTSCFGQWYTKRQLNKVQEKHPNGHSNVVTLSYGGISVTIIAQNDDNYSYIVTCDQTGDCALVDVGDARPILKFLNVEKRTPQAVLVTHKHWDHCYGNKELKKHFKKLSIYGSEIDRPSGANRYVRDETVIEIGSLRFKALHVPGHTAGHMIYVLELADDRKCLFTGDFLFVAGIGKIFEGNASQMISSLSILKHFSSDTLIFPGHEYAKLNVGFALSLEKDNKDLKLLSRTVHEKRNVRSPIAPVTLGDEYKVNPYLRTNSLRFRKALASAGYDVSLNRREMDGDGDSDNTADDDDEVIDSSVEAQVAVFDALKKAKNNFTEELIKHLEQKRQKESRNNG